jgi:ribose transport system permease protein
VAEFGRLDILVNNEADFDLTFDVNVWVLAVIAAAAGFTLRYTTFGRHVYAVGDNPEAARLSGINTNRVVFGVYVIGGLCAAVSALIIVSRLTAGSRARARGSSWTPSPSSSSAGPACSGAREGSAGP